MKKLNKKCLREVKSFYKAGEGLKSVPLKNYTSGDGANHGFENLVEGIIWMVLDDLGIDRKRVDIHNRYFQSDYSVSPTKDPKDPQRMDHHIMIDGKHPLIVESRAWIDKPFYTLKRAVTRNFMGLAIDIMDRLPKALDISQGHGDRINVFKFSPHRRGWKGGNYFDHGVNNSGVSGFVKFIYNHLKKYQNL